MDFSLDEVQQAIRDLARKIFTERVTQPALRAAEADPDRILKSLWVDLAQAGLLGTAIPERFGGGGHGLMALTMLLEEAGAAVAPVPLWPALVLGALPLDAFGSEEQKALYLPRIAAGECILTAGLVEVDSDDPAAPTTTARSENDRWMLSGQKTCVPAAHLVERVIVVARTPGGAPALFLVDPRGPGATLEQQVATNGEIEGLLTLSSAPGEPLGKPGVEVVRWLVERATVGLCALEVGVTERALRMTASYTSSRHQFERPIATFQAVSQRAGDAYIDAQVVRLAAWQAAWRLEAGLPASDEVAIAKFWAAEAGHRVVFAAQHLHGGMGFDRDYPLHRYYTWSRKIELTLGGAERQLARLGASMASA